MYRGFLAEDPGPISGLSQSRFMHVFTESVGIPVRPYFAKLCRSQTMSHYEALFRLTVGDRNEIQYGNKLSDWDYGRKSMKRRFTLILAALATAAMFGGLVHAVLVLAHVSEPAAT